ncbi:MAG: DUF2341 domain-containing protein [Nevskia sp.]|nr:DUF2341 domain-containing protein [Nevskia sp.]
MFRRPAAAVAALAAGLLLAPMSASAWWSHDWSYRKQITLDASPKGADLKADLADVPVLVRLHDGVFKFSDANPDGSDIRFVADDDKTPLKFHVEKFDSVFNLAFVWVQVPRLKAGAPTSLWLYYGNPKAVAEGDARETYGPAQTLVYHFGERGTPAADATGYRNNATSAFQVDESGLIGNAAKFDGQTAIGLPASPSLAVPAGSPLTWSAWIKPAAADQDAVIYALHDGARALVIGLAKGAPYVALADDSGALRQSPAGAALAAGGWHHLALVAAAPASPQATLYVDGEPGPVLAGPLPALAAAASLGGQAGTPATAGFRGGIDELEIAKAALDPATIQLFAGNQGTADKLVQFGGDEAMSTWSSGYVGIILHSVTLDGWVIISILLVMAAVSWIVMVRKAGQIQLVTRANRVFMEMFRSTGGDFGALRHLVGGTAAVAGTEISERTRRLVGNSPLLKLFNAGSEELSQRLNARKTPKNGKAPAVLSEQSIEAIRASVDSTLITETQALNRLMVLLTIAISGGPFIGLLGTVVGVMITFAAVAAAGDVNVNAIAPGIAAALVATVAGLFVAIPALFGYNYLLTRIKEITAQMHVFVDALVTRMAESYNSPDELAELGELAGQ